MKKAKIAILAVLCLVLCLCATACTPHEHVYDQIGSDETTHWYYCAEDNEKDEDTIGGHVDDDLNGKCDVCNHEMAIPFNVAISGKDVDCHDVSLNGYVATIKSASVTANVTIKNGKIVWKDYTDGTYTLSVSGEKQFESTTLVITNGAADAIVLNEVLPIEEKIALETLDSVPALVVVGKIDSQLAQAGCIKLHAQGNDAHKYWNNVSDRSDAYKFIVPLTELPIDGTPWWFFHIYAYAEAEPAADATPVGKQDLPLGSINYGDVREYDGIRYTVINDKDSGQLVIQPTYIPAAIEITSVTVDTTDGIKLVVVGTYENVPCIKIHADHDKDNCYWDNLATEEGKLEFRIDLTELKSDGVWYWFHVYTYEEANPTDNASGKQDRDLNRGSELAIKQEFEYDGIRYVIQAWNDVGDGLALSAHVIPTAKVEVTSIAIDETNASVLVVKGTYENASCIKLHADAEYGDPKVKHHHYGDNVSTTDGAFELRFDLTQIPVAGTPWAWFHIYTYDVAEPTDLEAEATSFNLERGSIPVGYSTDYNGIRYTVQDQTQFVIQPTVIPAKIEITSVTVDETDGLKLVVVGTYENVPCIKIHANNKTEQKYWDNLATEEGKLEFSIDLTKLASDGDWYWFHVYTYTEANPTDNATGVKDSDLNRGSALTIGQTFDVAGIRYTIQAWNGTGDGLAISASVLPKFTVTGVTVSTDGGLKVVATGTVPEDVKCVVIRAKGNGDDKWYGDKATIADGAFTATFDVTKLSADGTPWCYFHVMTFAEESPEAYTETDGNCINLPLGSIEYGSKIDFNGIRYEVIKPGWDGQLVIQPKALPKFEVSSVTVSTDGGLKVVATGTVPEDVKCVVIRAKGNGDDKWYGDKATIADGAFTATFDVTKLSADGTPWCYFHVMTFAEESPEAYTETDGNCINLPLGSIAYGSKIDFNGIRYEVIKPGWDGQLVIQPKAIPATIEITSVTVDETDGLKLVVVGTYENVPCIKIHADHSKDNCYWDNLATEEGKLEFRIDLTQFASDGEWYWFHVYTYTEANPTDNASGQKQGDLNRGSALTIGQTFDVAGIRYTIQAWNGTGDGLAISASAITAE